MYYLLHRLSRLIWVLTCFRAFWNRQLRPAFSSFLHQHLTNNNRNGTINGPSCLQRGAERRIVSLMIWPFELPADSILADVIKTKPDRRRASREDDENFDLSDNNEESYDPYRHYGTMTSKFRTHHERSKTRQSLSSNSRSEAAFPFLLLWVHHSLYSQEFNNWITTIHFSAQHQITSLCNPISRTLKDFERSLTSQPSRASKHDLPVSGCEQIWQANWT